MLEGSRLRNSVTNFGYSVVCYGVFLLWPLNPNATDVDWATCQRNWWWEIPTEQLYTRYKGMAVMPWSQIGLDTDSKYVMVIGTHF